MSGTALVPSGRVPPAKFWTVGFAETIQTAQDLVTAMHVVLANPTREHNRIHPAHQPATVKINGG